MGNCKRHRWHYVSSITNPGNEDYGKILFFCDKCGKEKLVKANWIIKNYGKKLEDLK